MRLTKAALGVAGVPLLSGCMMMGGWGHTAGLQGAAGTGPVMSGQATVSWRRAEASSDGLALTLSVPAPTGSAAVTIEAWLRSDGDDREPADGDVWLRVRTPQGNIERLRMREPQTPGDGMYRAQYAFASFGAYLVTADARSGTGADVRTVSVTIAVEAGGDRWGDRSNTPAGLVGGLGALALLAAMMGGVTH